MKVNFENSFKGPRVLNDKNNSYKEVNRLTGK